MPKIEKEVTKNIVSFGIPELDNVLQGGIPRNSLILLSGNPGTGKTILGTQFLYNGALKHGEKGVYVSFAENRDDYCRNMLSLGMDMKGLEDKGLFKFLDLITVKEEGIDETVKIVMKEISDFGAKRVVIDSISVITQVLGQPATRAFLHTVLNKIFKALGVTTIMVGEIPSGESRTGFGIEEFVADGVILLKSTRSGTADRKVLEITKMRGVALDRTSLEYLIDKEHNGIGPIVLPTRVTIEKAPTDKITTGTEGLDKMLVGGLYRGSITLVEGTGGVGKTSLGLQFLFSNAEKGQKGIFLSFEEPTGQIMRLLKNYGVDYGRLGGRLTIESYVPEALTPLHYYKILRDLLEKHRPSLLVIDSVTAMQHQANRESFLEFLRHLQLMCKEMELTTILTSQLGTPATTLDTGISTMVDNIIIMRYYELKDRLSREIYIVKTRGSDHEKRVVPFEVTEKGVVVQY